MKYWSKLLLPLYGFLLLCCYAVADVTLSGTVGTFDVNGINCLSSAQSSGSSAAIMLDCVPGDQFGTQAHIAGNAAASTGNIFGVGESGPMTGGFYSFTLNNTQSFTFATPENVVLQIDAAAIETGLDFSFSFDGTTVMEDVSGGFTETYSFLVESGTYPFLLTASSTGGGTNGNTNFSAFDYTLLFSPAPVPEPSTLLLLGTGLLGAAGTLRRKYIA